MLKPIKVIPEADDWDAHRRAIIGLGPHSFGKSYYAQLSQQLAEARRLELAIEQSPIGVAICKRDGNVEYANGVLAKLFSCPMHDLLAQGLHRLWSKVVEGEPFERFVDKAVKGEALQGDLLVRVSEDERRWVALILSPIHDISGEITHLLGSVEDISLRKRFEDDLVATGQARQRALEAAQAASRTKSAFVANMSHEIRTPLNAILGMAHLIRRGGLNPEQTRQLAKLEKASDHLLDVINSVLDLSKIEAGKFTLDERPVEIPAVIANIRSLLRERVEAKGLQLECTVDALPEGLRGDPTRLQQALLNFAGNAVKFTNKGSIRINVQLLENAGSSALIRFEVRDTGIGIPADIMPRLFSAFEQADNSLTRNQQGTGLGLSISKKMARLMGGDAGAESVQGQGSTFWFTARLKVEIATPTVTRHSAVAPELALRQEFAGARVLLVDDEPINLEIAKAMLEEAGLTVVTAENGAKAVEAWAEADFELILMDMQMPKMDGLDATRLIRRTPARPVAPVVAMTANAFAEDRVRCFEAGMNDFITKPIDPELLCEVVLNWLRQSRQPYAPYRFAWSDAYSVGGEAMDRQHRQLLHICGEAAHCLDQPGHGDITEVLTQLRQYAAEHFRAEERMLEEREYPLLAEQESEHRAYLTQLSDLLMAASLHALNSDDVFRFALNWWQAHILQEDMAYRNYFALTQDE